MFSAGAKDYVEPEPQKSWSLPFKLPRCLRHYQQPLHCFVVCLDDEPAAFKILP